MGESLPPPVPPFWSQDDVHRVLLHVVTRYIQALQVGGDDELMRSAIFHVAIPTLKLNNFWPETAERLLQDAERPLQDAERPTRYVIIYDKPRRRWWRRRRT